MTLAVEVELSKPFINEISEEEYEEHLNHLTHVRTQHAEGVHITTGRTPAKNLVVMLHLNNGQHLLISADEK